MQHRKQISGGLPILACSLGLMLSGCGSSSSTGTQLLRFASGGFIADSTATLNAALAQGLNLLFDAGTVNSPALLTIGTAGSHVNHSADPTGWTINMGPTE